jgi:tetratricopeptide (TPR) repeat protein
MTERAAEAKSGAVSSSEEISLKDRGNGFFKAGNYLKAAALYTQAIKLDPSNPTLYR